MRVGLTYRCATCKMENYHGFKNKQKHAEKQEFTKYCPKCNAHTTHQEAKLK